MGSCSTLACFTRIRGHVWDLGESFFQQSHRLLWIDGDIELGLEFDTWQPTQAAVWRPAAAAIQRRRRRSARPQKVGEQY